MRLSLKEEIKEFTMLCGRIPYQDSFALRLGYFNESPKRQEDSSHLGAGFKYTSVNIDVSYLFSASKVPNPPRILCVFF
jgi:hypothetical protein